jgi:hypothetical protein
MNQYPNGPQPPYQQPPGGYPPQGQYPGPQFTQQPGYPPQYPPVQQPQPQQTAPQPKKKQSKLAIGCGSLIALVVVIGVISAISSGGKGSSTPVPSGGSNSNSTQQSPSKPTSWQTMHTYSGNGNQKTETIAVPNDWKILWSCDATSFMGSQYNVMVEVDNSDGTTADLAVNTICSSGNTSGVTEEHQSGNVYLNVTSEAKWSILVQEQK